MAQIPRIFVREGAKCARIRGQFARDSALKTELEEKYINKVLEEQGEEEKDCSRWVIDSYWVRLDRVEIPLIVSVSPGLR